MLLKYQILAVVVAVVVGYFLIKKYGSPLHWLKKLWGWIKGLF